MRDFKADYPLNLVYPKRPPRDLAKGYGIDLDNTYQLGDAPQIQRPSSGKPGNDIWTDLPNSNPQLKQPKLSPQLPSPVKKTQPSPPKSQGSKPPAPKVPPSVPPSVPSSPKQPPQPENPHLKDVHDIMVQLGVKPAQAQKSLDAISQANAGKPLGISDLLEKALDHVRKNS